LDVVWIFQGFAEFMAALPVRLLQMANHIRVSGAC
jgi:hypothetical protein